MRHERVILSSDDLIMHGFHACTIINFIFSKTEKGEKTIVLTLKAASHVIHPRSNAFYFFPWNLQQIQRAHMHYLTGQILSYNTPLFNTLT